jgi:hypothetical protein
MADLDAKLKEAETKVRHAKNSLSDVQYKLYHAKWQPPEEFDARTLKFYEELKEQMEKKLKEANEERRRLWNELMDKRTAELKAERKAERNKSKKGASRRRKSRKTATRRRKSRK